MIAGGFQAQPRSAYRAVTPGSGSPSAGLEDHERDDDREAHELESRDEEDAAQQWGFGQTWVAVSMGLRLVSVIAGAVYIGPRTKKIAELFEAEGPTSTAARALLGRVFLVSRLELVSFAVIIALMVFKPGAGGA